MDNNTEKSELSIHEVVWPSHPLVTAWFITQAFPSYEEAAAPSSTSSFGASCAQCSRAVPGGSGSVQAALDVLYMICEGEPFDDAFSYGDQEWERNGLSPKRRADGQKQADCVKPLLKSVPWGTFKVREVRYS